MTPWIPEEALREARAESQAAAALMRLPFRATLWRGTFGNWAGAGIGSSIDFQDHRPYLPGDDPRYINWQAYARTGVYSMKLYREEVNPRVDIVLDTSPSMFFTPEKRGIALGLFYFAIESAVRNGSVVRCHAVDGAEVRGVGIDAAQRGDLPMPGAAVESASPSAFAAVPYQPGSLRVIVSDLLYPGAPEEALRHCAAGKGRGVVLAPFVAEESEPSWTGSMELVDCETRRRRLEQCDPLMMRRYHRSYRRHFDLWRGQARRFGIPFARIGGGAPLRAALMREALPEGAVEPWA